MLSVHGNSVPCVVLLPAKVGDIDQLVAVRAILGDERISVPPWKFLCGTLCRERDGVRIAGDVGAASFVYRNGKAGVIARRAEIHRKLNYRIDHQRQRSVVFRQRKTDMSVRLQTVRACYLHARALHILVDVRPVLPHVADEQIAIRRKLRVRALIGDIDQTRICARSHHHVVFQFLAAAVIDDVDAGIHLRVANLSELRHAGPPVRWAVASEIVADRRNAIHALCLITFRRAMELHPDRRVAFRTQHGAAGGEKHGMARRTRDEFHSGIHLSAIRLEVNRKVPDVFDRCRQYGIH